MSTNSNGGQRRKTRTVRAGDVLPASSETTAATATIADRIEAAQESKANALEVIVRETPALVEEVEALLQGASCDDLQALKELLFSQSPESLPISPDD